MDHWALGIGCGRRQEFQRLIELRNRLEASSGSRFQRGLKHGTRDLGNRAVYISPVRRHAGEEMMEHGP
jgi:hypothetical protein